MNGDTPHSTSSSAYSSHPSDGNASAFVPLVLITLSLILIFIWQITNASKQRDSLRAAQEQLETAYRNSAPQQEQMLQQSHAVQAKLETLVTDLLNLAKEGDPDAKAIQDKYKIQQNAAPGGAAASSSPAVSQ